MLAEPGARRWTGVTPAILSGVPTCRSQPNVGWSMPVTMSRAIACSSASASSTEYTGPHGTWPRIALSQSPVVRRAKSDASSGISAARCA